LPVVDLADKALIEMTTFVAALGAPAAAASNSIFAPPARPSR
jgi:hypothetical protein